MTAVCWLLVLLLWTALDLAGPVVTAPAAAGEGLPEEAVAAMRIGWRAAEGLAAAGPASEPGTGQEAAAARTFLAAARPLRRRPPPAVRKLPPSRLDPGAVREDPH